MPPETKPQNLSPSPDAPAKGGGASQTNRLLFIAVAVLAVWGGVSPFLFKGGGEKPEKPPDGGSAAPSEGSGDVVPGKQIGIPEVTVPMKSPRESEYPALKLAAVLVLRPAPKDPDEKMRARQAEMERAIEDSAPWIQEQVYTILYQIPPEDRGQLLYEAGGRNFQDRLKEIVNRRFRPRFGEDVVREVWLPVRRPAY